MVEVKKLKNVPKIQSVGRAFAVLQLRKKNGAEDVVEKARAHDEKALDKLVKLSTEERVTKELDDDAYEARGEESRRLHREQFERERIAELEFRQKQSMP